MLRRTYAEINLRAINNNLSQFRKIIGDEVKILLPVKADAYGHGLVEVSKFVEEKNAVDMLGIASLDEGIELRNAGITLPVLLLGLILPEKEHIETLLEYNLSQTVADFRLAREISKTAGRNNKTATIHIKVDTGMGRIGCRIDDAVEITKKIVELENLNLEGIYSHFPVADELKNEFTAVQISVFKNILERLKKTGIEIPLKHMANSAGTVNFPDSIMNMIRPGIMVYGYLPTRNMKPAISIEPSMTLKSCISFVKRVSRGVPLSYGLTYSAVDDANIATIPIGYGDGYRRDLSNRSRVIIQKRYYPVVGRVTMDQILVNLGDDIYEPGEEVILFGNSDITANEIAEYCNTIPYEITCGISKRVPRIYLR